MLTIHRPGLDGPFPAAPRYYHGVPDPTAYQPAPKPHSTGVTFYPMTSSTPRTAVDSGIQPQAEGKPAPQAPGPDAATPTATVTSPTGVTEAMPATLPAEPEAVATPKRWPWVVGGIAAAGALILGTRLLRR
ncbi:MAG: hypothetical protein IPJ61_19470 [Tessaracoccus sp.]|uniref:hypothetical protein n=1 Tax=Tessaracoccus sp. TaxID=1971211 RepID=UPI001EB1B509|nr:hypothetical protein [Tessaracoccus sp.]MBK7823167.1 hypothetical protein [Tessaracoccus sp.]